jgi:dUTPase
MSFQHKNKYTLYIKLDDINMSNDLINYYKELSFTSLSSENSGIDLYIPEYIKFELGTNCIDHKISCCMIDNSSQHTCGYYLYPRSSMYKYPLITSNSVGIIDAGYRGFIKGMVRCFEEGSSVNIGNKLFQLCAPDLSPLKVVVLGVNQTLPMSDRGNNGFGSTGN